MWSLYKEGGWKAWILPIALLANGAVQLLMLYYFVGSFSIVSILMIALIILCFLSSIALGVVNIIKKDKKREYDNKVVRLKKMLVGIALTGLLITPFVGASTVIFTKLNSSIPSAGLELLSGNSQGMGMQMGSISNSSSSKLIEFLEKNKTSTQKYLLVVDRSNSGADIIIKTGENVMALGGFGGSDRIITLDQFKEMAKKGEVRYVMVSGQGHMGGTDSSENSNSAIMNWAKGNGTLVSSSEYSNSDTTNNAFNGMSHDGEMLGQLYDLKAYTDSNKTK